MLSAFILAVSDLGWIWILQPELYSANPAAPRAKVQPQERVSRTISSVMTFVIIAGMFRLCAVLFQSPFCPSALSFLCPAALHLLPSINTVKPILHITNMLTVRRKQCSTLCKKSSPCWQLCNVPDCASCTSLGGWCPCGTLCVMRTEVLGV